MDATNDMLFVKAILIGFLISLPTGPVGFLCIRRTLISGARAGMYSACGAVLSDIFYVSIVSLGLSYISSHIIFLKDSLRFLGSVLLLFIGLKGMNKKIPDGTLILSDSESRNEFFSTFILNITNPILIITYGFIFNAFNIKISISDYTSLFVFVLGIVSGSVIFWYLFTNIISLIHKKFFRVDLQKINYVTSLIILITGVVIITSIFI